MLKIINKLVLTVKIRLYDCLYNWLPDIKAMSNFNLLFSKLLTVDKKVVLIRLEGTTRTEVEITRISKRRCYVNV